MDQKLSDFKEDLECLCKQYMDKVNVIIGRTEVNGKKQIVIIIEDYEKIHGVK
ncbi:hypothetical protein LCGC14_1978360 [marine sediment metagenome]|uniref:Uncharacterized protein n=1 Tax=marine sediment metagenome TaxID=412755 RepID=A0A0F9F9Z6_9ZZZZ